MKQINKSIIEFQKQKCDNCINKKTDLCEITTSSLDGHAYCKNLEEKNILFRFMSKKEFEAFREGKTLINETKHQGKTNSEGFCFFNINDYTPEEALHFLSGIVSFDVCVVFETKRILKQTYGIYAEPIKEIGNILDDLIKVLSGQIKKFTATEYCTTKYNNKDFKILKYGENLWKQWKPEEQTKIKWIEV